MTTGVLGQVALGYQLLWNRQRAPVTAVHLIAACAGRLADPYFERCQVTLTAQEALSSLHASPRAHPGQEPARPRPGTSPLKPAHIYEGLASRALVEHALDEQQVWAVAGWPVDDVMHGYRAQQVQPHHIALVDLIEALDAEDAMESIEERLGEDPVLAYRFLRFANSAAFGLRTQIATLRHGLLLVGPLSAALPRIRLPERVSSAMVGRAGPYLSYLEVARALESAPALCATRHSSG